MAFLVLVTGPPGAGKSTVAGEFAEAAIDPRHVLGDLAGPAEEAAMEIFERIQGGTLRYPCVRDASL